jgi:hypothetical protein
MPIKASGQPLGWQAMPPPQQIPDLGIYWFAIMYNSPQEVRGYLGEELK